MGNRGKIYELSFAKKGVDFFPGLCHFFTICEKITQNGKLLKDEHGHEMVKNGPYGAQNLPE